MNWRENGKRKQKCIGTGLSASGNNKRKALKIRDSILQEWESRIAQKTTNISFADFLEQWLEIIKPTIAESTYCNYRHTLLGVICPYYAEQKILLANLTCLDLQAFYRYRMESAGISPNTVRHYHAYIHKALDYAVSSELISKNPADQVELPRKRMHESMCLDADGIRTLIKQAKNTDMEAVVMLAAQFGLRRGEILGLKWSDFDFVNKLLHIRGVFSRGDGLIYKEPKTNASKRVFPLTDEMAAYWQSIRERQERNKRTLGRHYCLESEAFVCVNSRGHHLTPDYVTRQIPKLCRQCGINTVKLHELRHTNISLLLQNGASLKELQEWAGHSSYTTTADIYAHVQADSKKKLSYSIQNILIQ